MAIQNVAILGATGSIGQNALKVIALYPERFRVHSICGGHRVKELADVAIRVRPDSVGIADQTKAGELKELLRAAGLAHTEIIAGTDAAKDLAQDPEADTVIGAVVGAAGLAPSFAAARSGKRLLLANKESVVCGGSLLMNTIEKHHATLLPVDSEHNAIFQCLDGTSETEKAKAKIWLTCSGGPFRSKKDLDLSTVTPEMALNHPTWNMGSKISIDSATLMNKGFEVIEAHHLFGVAPEAIRVVVHPQSVLHSMVEFSDGSVIGQMGPTDMRLAIAYCLGYPERLSGLTERLDFTKLSNLTFEAADEKRFPLLKTAYEALKAGGIASIVLNAANEVAVAAFLNRKIRFTDISRVCRKLVEQFTEHAPSSEEDILSTDAEARARAKILISYLA